MEQDFNAKAVDYKFPIALTYSDVEPFYLNLSQLGILGLCGKENTGHKNFITNIMNSLERNRETHPVSVAVFDDITRKFEYLKSSPIVNRYSLNIEPVAEIINQWHSVLSERYDSLIESGNTNGKTELFLMLIQNNDVAKAINDDFELMEKFTDMISRFKGMNVAFVFTNFQNASVSYDAPEPLRLIKQEQHIIFFENLDNLKPFEVPYEELKVNRKRLETGDAYYIQDNMVTKLKMIKAESQN